ncbi:TPA: phage antirepressor N-terminal domain-containing protein [Stenotrophomonas maltophilia]|uniref:phage antirepressor N-terminal domain-containing protein n=1 Tax=Stenotrophomonas maltophilia TaxID=40324 RepID=UPI000C1477B0|nr:phage antirepressor N-terminal domain-containing protein [Stenotrophomonas maltophilia]MBH1886851.1 hypothetical protein [Stenotrophomonas maltophilia]MDG9769654.1 phage antirepressor N-terminal domain-containing protein [Stenotrophomonas maltophilia]MDH0540026.1 phage antirepressor N-terminal domain-containing protein [Stenotrophomonas maltophilia]MDH0794122.1 phage antirepressor N-terminal domain-containing protein [Stenotrophomonas maltophilia]MDH2032510.1 phage antirepressor N-terminal 
MHPTTDSSISQERTMQQTEDRATRAVNFINFHGLTLMVVEHEGVEYVEAKPLTDLAGIDWRGARRALQEGDSAILYGATRLEPPSIAGLGGLKSPPEGVLYLRLDRSRMYMARISTDRMRANGNGDAADQVLALQIEWAGVLHRYETQGIAMKNGRNGILRDLLALAKTRDGLNDPRERSAFTHLLHEEMRAIGLPMDSLDAPQGKLPLNA